MTSIVTDERESLIMEQDEAYKKCSEEDMKKEEQRKYDEELQKKKADPEYVRNQRLKYMMPPRVDTGDELEGAANGNDDDENGREIPDDNGNEGDHDNNDGEENGREIPDDNGNEGDHDNNDDEENGKTDERFLMTMATTTKKTGQISLRRILTYVRYA